MDVFRKLLKLRLKGSINLMVERFQHVFEAHDIDVSQIPRLIPQIRYEDLDSPKQLLAALTPAVVDATAHLFGVRGRCVGLGMEPGGLGSKAAWLNQTKNGTPRGVPLIKMRLRY